jgi:hypothetical protein
MAGKTSVKVMSEWKDWKGQLLNPGMEWKRNWELRVGNFE